MSSSIIDLEPKLEALWPRALYYPSRDGAALQLQAYAAACFNRVLNHSEEIRVIFGLMVQLWQLPDYHKLMRVYYQRLSEIRQWYREWAKAIMHNQPKPPFPAVCIEDVKAVLSDFSSTRMVKCLDTIIKLGFNRESDLENHILRIRPETSPYLMEAIFLASITYHMVTSGLEYRQDRVLTVEELMQLRVFSSLMENDPTTRPAKKAKHIIAQALKDIYITGNESGSRLDPSVARGAIGFTDKMIIDATWNTTYLFPPRPEWGGNVFPPIVATSPQMLDFFKKRWSEYGIGK